MTLVIFSWQSDGIAACQSLDIRDEVDIVGKNKIARYNHIFLLILGATLQSAHMVIRYDNEQYYAF